VSANKREREYARKRYEKWEARKRAQAQRRRRTIAAGTVIALDPDIPRDNQRVLFRASGSPQARWTLDKQPVGPAGRPYPWVPYPGAHTLALVDGDRTLDQIRFQVRMPVR